MFLILILFITCYSSPGQTCVQTALSKTFNFKIQVNRIKTVINDSCIITITITNKPARQFVQTIKYSTIYLYGNVFSDCNFVRSYTTGKNKNVVDIDNDFGDLIIADFNFDGKDDLAVKNDSGGNGGPSYNYYVQNKGGKFIIDKFLTGTMVFFPTNFNKAKRTLTTLVHANAYEMCKTTYKLTTASNKWLKVKRTFVKY